MSVQAMEVCSAWFAGVGTGSYLCLSSECSEQGRLHPPSVQPFTSILCLQQFQLAENNCIACPLSGKSHDDCDTGAASTLRPKGPLSTPACNCCYQIAFKIQ